MKNYKDFEKIKLGDSDIASLIAVGTDENGVKTEIIKFGGDNSYNAYYVTENDVVIPEHYTLVAELECWLKIYDDFGLVFNEYGKQFKIYRSGDYGMIIQKIN